MGLIESCIELATAYSDRLILEEQARSAYREKLLIALVVYASLLSSSHCNCSKRQKEEKTMIQWLVSIFRTSGNPYPISAPSVWMTGIC
ncbi:hypothetical protein [Microcoleus sp. OTE_8_concoct_300]|uniref:hypothetical protein n=1 Tax=Microcoleus sp. OTE_8_concoct_300 TaxID=2964710 RepID=UPI00403F1A6B